MITEVKQQGRFYRLSTGRVALRKPEASRPISGRLLRTTELGRTRVSTGLIFLRLEKGGGKSRRKGIWTKKSSQ